MQYPVEKLARVLLHDALRYRVPMFALFTVIALSSLAVGLHWPKKFTSYTSIFIEEKNVIQPLMVGAAAPMDVRERANIAKEVIFSRYMLDEVIKEGGWLVENMSPIDVERLRDEIKSRTSVQGRGKSLIRIEYSDTDAERAYLVTKKYAELFIRGSRENKVSESTSAFDFIDGQAEIYHKKLLESEHTLKEFRSANPDIRPGSQADVSARVNTLRNKINGIQLDLQEARKRKTSLEKQISGEARMTESLGREKMYQQRLAELQSQLNQLRLSYHDNYPDIVILKTQINELKSDIERERKARTSPVQKSDTRPQDRFVNAATTNPLYASLRAGLSATKTQIQTLEAKIAGTQGLLQEEFGRAQRINDMDAKLKELTRDYEVQRNIYEDLARRRENARVTVKLEEQNQGLTFRIEEPAAIPLRPTGLRFIHFMIAGLLAGILAPLSLLYLMFTFDPRIRLPDALYRQKLPVIASVSHLYTPSECRAATVSYRVMGALFLLVVAAYIAIGVLRLQGKL